MTHQLGGHTSLRRRMLGAALFALIFSPAADAALRNQWTFNGNANDSVGGQNATIVDNTGISMFTGGELDLRANNGAGSGQDFSQPATVGAYVDLPNHVFTDAVLFGEFGQATLEGWFTVDTHRDWARLWDIGTSSGGEDISNGGTGPYTIFTPQRGDSWERPAASTRQGGESFVMSATPNPIPVNVKQHVVVTFDQFDTSAGENGTLKLYLNNGTPIVGPIATGMALEQMNDVNVWLGRAQYPDPLFDGLIDEFRIYDHALSSGEVSTSFTTGPVPVPLPVLRVDRATGAMSLVNPASTAFNLTGYSIGSASGGLVPGSWNSVDAGNVFDNNGTWTPSSSTQTLIAESVTGGTLDGGTLAGGASVSIGNAWLRTPVSSDLTFSFTLNGGPNGAGVVEYVGSAPARSDLNGDGALTPADWAIFTANHRTNLAGNLPAVAYSKGDLNGTLTNDYADFQLFKADYIAANGEAAFAALTSVPEPASLALALAAGGTLLCRRFKRRS
ncbi:MAG: LamG domain-containing protein [Pirellulales bacterium]|nr:LamG domain-containing protein [Pirellulales bacterium]